VNYFNTQSTTNHCYWTTLEVEAQLSSETSISVTYSTRRGRRILKGGNS